MIVLENTLPAKQLAKNTKVTGSSRLHFMRDMRNISSALRIGTFPSCYLNPGNKWFIIGQKITIDEKDILDWMIIEEWNVDWRATTPFHLRCSTCPLRSENGF